MIQLNLLPDVKKEFLHAQQTRNAVISISSVVVILSASITTLLAMGVYGGQTLLRRSIESQIEDNYAALRDEPQIDKYLTVQNQLQNIDQLHTDKTVYSRVATYLSALNPAPPSNVVLTSARLSKEDRTLTIE